MSRPLARARFRAFGILAAILSVPAALALESPDPDRIAYIKEITDSSTSQYTINNFRMSRDGSRAVFLVTQTVLDGRGCNAQQLRTIPLSGAPEEIVNQGFTYDTGVGNFCASSLYSIYDISDDGGKVAYFRHGPLPNLTPELVVYDTVLKNELVILTSLPFRSFGLDSTPAADPQNQFGLLRMSGDGSKVFFMNRYGPYGNPGVSGDPGPSGFTIYRVPSLGGAATAVISQSNFASIPGIDVNVGQFLLGQIDVDYGATNLAFGLAQGNGVTAVQLAHVNPSIGAGSAAIIQSIAGGSFTGPSISADGTQLAFTRVNSGNAATDGLFVRAASPVGGLTLVDPGDPVNGRYPTQPFLSGGGQSTSHHYDGSIRWARADGTLLVPASLPAVRTTSAYSAVSSDGSTILMLGAVMPDGNAGFIPTPPVNLVRFQWSGLGDPSISGAEFSPTFHFVRQNSLSPTPEFHKIFFSSFSLNAGTAYTYPFDRLALSTDGIRTGGFNRLGGILDDGAFEGVDAAASDGIFSDGGMRVFDTYLEETITVRLAATSRFRSAAYADLTAPVLPVTAQTSLANVQAGDTAPVSLPNAKITADFASNSQAGQIRGERFDGVPPGLTTSLNEYWRVVGLEQSQFSATLTFEYTEPIGAAPKLAPESDFWLKKSSDSGKTWTFVKPTVNTTANTIVTQNSQSVLGLFGLSEPPPVTSDEIRNYLLGISGLSPAKAAAADLNADGAIDIADLIGWMRQGA